jgi:hypothetical protein
MDPEDAQKYRFNPFDVTKVWSHKVRNLVFFCKKKNCIKKNWCVCGVKNGQAWKLYLKKNSHHMFFFFHSIGLSSYPRW